MSCGNPHAVPCADVLDRVYEYLDGEIDNLSKSFFRVEKR